MSQVRKHVLLAIKPELIHATLEAIRYTRRTVRGIHGADTAGRGEGDRKKEGKGRSEGERW